MKRIGLTALACALALPAMANDSSSELAAGGLVLSKTDVIAMQREDLTLSPNWVQIRYEMRNDTDKPVTLRVAFPMPDVPIDTPAGKGLQDANGQEIAHNIDLPSIQEPNFLGFHVVVDGKEQQAETEIGAYLPDGRDIVKSLYRIGGWRLVLQPGYYQRDPAPGQATADDIGPTIDQALRKIGAVEGDANAAMPRWTTRIMFHWMQTFKPGVTVIEHRYHPVLGMHLVASTGKDGSSIDPDHGTWIASGIENPARDFCIAGDKDRTMRDWYRKIIKSEAHKDGYPATATLGYILRTARNWAGPIGTFHLTIEGGPMPHADERVTVGAIALCTDFPMRETAPQRLEATVTNYVPSRDLRVMFLPNE